MIVAFGLRSQNQMRLAGSGPSWQQLTKEDCLPGELGERWIPSGSRMKSLRTALALGVDSD